MPANFHNVYRIAILSVVALLLGLSLSSAWNEYQTAALAAQDISGDDMVTAWDKRLRKVRQILPDYGVVGYLADWDIPDYPYGSSDQEVEFLLAQYTVAPVVLERGADHKLILGNFGDNGDPHKIETVQKELGVKVIQSYSNEIFILEGKVK